MKKQAVNFQFSPRRFSRLVAVGTFLAAAMAFVANNSLAAVGPLLTYSASAYGTYAFVGGTIVAGKTAPVSVGPGCGSFIVPQTKTGTVLTVSVLPTIQTGQIDTSAASVVNSATGTADVHDITLLGTAPGVGLITATEVKAVSTTFRDATGFHSNGNGSSLVNLVIAGSLPINVVPAPNTTFPLAGFGKVVVNEQISTGSAAGITKGLTVNMLHVYVTLPNVLGIPVGTQIIVSDAVSGLRQVSGPGTLDGTAHGTQINGTIIKSSPTAPVSVGCNGNSLITNFSLGIHVVVPVTNYVVLDSGTITDTAQGTVAPGDSESHTTSTIQGVNLLNGFIQATLIHAQADASTTDGSTFTFSSAGSSFGTLTVAGFPAINANVPENTKIALTGIGGGPIGTLYLKRVTHSANQIYVQMILLVLTQPFNGLPTGTTIEVGQASASLHSPAHP